MGAESPSTERSSREATDRSQIRAVKIGTVVGAILAILLSILNWGAIRSSLSTFFDKERFRGAIIETLNGIASKGDWGLLLYSFGFIWWEACGLPTSVVETAAGMAFGFRRGLPASFVGKTLGSVAAFTLGRTLLSDAASKKMGDNNSFKLIERGVARNPLRSALVVRYSPFPQLVKNYALSVTRPVSFATFLLAACVHGFPFSLLWAALGEDSAARLRASEAGVAMAANFVLNGSLVFVTIFGFVVSPAVTGWWLAGLRGESGV